MLRMQPAAQACPIAVDVGGVTRGVACMAEFRERKEHREIGAAGRAFGQMPVHARAFVRIERVVRVPRQQALGVAVRVAFEGDDVAAHSACTPSSPSSAFMWRRA